MKVTIISAGSGVSGEFVPFPTDAGITKYVSTTGDDNNDGDTPATAYLTPHKGVNEACKYLGEKTVQFLDGTFNISTVLSIPIYATGRLNLIGDPTDPSNVVIDAGANLITIIGHGGDLSFLGGQNTLQNSCEVFIDGITLENGLFSFWVDGGKLTVGSLAMNPIGYGVTCAGVGKVFFSEVATASTITSSGGLGGFLLANQGSVICHQGLTLNNVEYGFNCDNSGTLEIVDGIDVTINLANTENAVGLFIQRGSDVNLNANFNIIGHPARTDGVGLIADASNPIIDIGEVVWSFEDLGVGMQLKNNTSFRAGDATFNYTNVTREVIYDSTSSYEHDNHLDTNPIAENAPTLTDGRDVRDMYFNLCT